MYKVSKLAAGSVIAASAALGGASVALADGYSAPRVAYERPTNWSGVYFGVGSGYQWNSTEVTIVPAGPSESVNQSNGVVDAHIGVQHQFGAVVLGIEGGWLSAFRDDWGKTNCPGGGICRQRLNDILTVGGRIGYAAGHWMPYVTGGFASGRFAHEVWLPSGPGGAQLLNNSMSTRNDGWYLGGGVEWAVSPGWSTGLEYRHYEFDSATGTAITPAGAIVNDRRLDASADTITARVSWRWGRPEAVPLK